MSKHDGLREAIGKSIEAAIGEPVISWAAYIRFGNDPPRWTFAGSHGAGAGHDSPLSLFKLAVHDVGRLSVLKQKWDLQTALQALYEHSSTQSDLYEGAAKVALDRAWRLLNPGIDVAPPDAAGAEPRTGTEIAIAEDEALA